MALARCLSCERVVDAEYRPIRGLTQADLKRTVAIVLMCTECMAKKEAMLTPGERLLDAGYRECLHCGRLMRDGVPLRPLTAEERSTFSPCMGLDWVCVECAITHPPRTGA
jgi:hypothetical protein